ncbi:uncharacterized protein LOC135948472 [Cloeon dipterum]|uniref:uncharacterized protein LOC135948472 n=1 Tax=Cloeon dipterum TaxID=197152 RepID=UPI0032200AE1
MLKLIAFYFLFVGIVQAHRHRGGGGRGRYRNDPLVCNKHYLMNAALCVTVPELFSADLFDQCNNELVASASTATQRLSRRRGRSAHRGGRNGRFGKWSRNWNGRSRCHDRYCAGQCVMNKTNNLLSNGSVDINALLTNFENKTTDAWKQIVSQAINDCWKNISSKLTTLDAQPGPKGVSKCSKGSMLTIICIQRYLFLNTPEDQKVNLVPSGQDNCTVRDNQLSNCDPLYLPTQSGGRGGGRGWNTQQGINNGGNFNEFADEGNPADVDIIDM